MDVWYGMDDDALQQYEEETSNSMRQNFGRGRTIGMGANEDSAAA
jgi:hypothetical protein